MNFIRLFRRDISWYLKPFAGLSIAACLICAVLTSALLIGESVRGTLDDNLRKNTAFVKTLLRFSTPVNADVRGGVLYTTGFISGGIRTHLYAFPGESAIYGRDAYCSKALAEALKLKIGDTFSVRIQTIAAIKSEELMGTPPLLKQIRFIYKGVWKNSNADVNFENPQLRSNNLFVNHSFLAQELGLKANAVNEVWSDKGLVQTRAEISDAVIWDLSQLTLDQWQKRPILKSKAYFLPQKAVNACPSAQKGLISFAESLSDSTTTLNYFFVGAFEGDILPVKPGSLAISSVLQKKLKPPVSLTCFTTDEYRRISNKTQVFNVVSIASDTMISSILTPDIPGLTDVSDCSRWISGLPINLKRIKDEDKDYWELYKSKPKVYLNFAQAQQLFAPGQCTLLIFDAKADIAEIKKRIINELRDDPALFQCIPVAEIMKKNIQNGIQFAPLFLGLSLFIIISGLLILLMLLKLHLFDRSAERQILAEFVACENKVRRFYLIELLLILLPGIFVGLLLGTLLCMVQLRLLERVWNGIILMKELNFHAAPTAFIIAFAATFCSAFIILAVSLHFPVKKSHFYIRESHSIQSLCALGTLSFFRRFRQYGLCVVLLVLGIIGTLGVGAFGIKVRGEDGFSYEYIAETALPVVPSFDAPFPAGGLPVRVYHADNADCSNLLQASKPTVYGCNLEVLTGKSDFLKKLCAAVDVGSLQWIMKKKLGDVIHYPNGSITLERTLKASVFQSGILVDNSTFEALFPDVQGAQFFLIRDPKSAEAYQTYLEPFGLTMSTVDSFMAKAESVQNRYLAIFLQLGVLGFILGIGSLLLMMLRNLHAQRNEIRFLSELGFTDVTLFRLYCIENLWIYGLAATVSLFILGGLALFTRLNLSILLSGWVLLVSVGIGLIVLTLKIFFSGFRASEWKLAEQKCDNKW